MLVKENVLTLTLYCNCPCNYYENIKKKKKKKKMWF